MANNDDKALKRPICQRSGRTCPVGPGAREGCAAAHAGAGLDSRFDVSRASNLFGGGAYTRDVEDRDSPDDVSGSAPTEFSITDGYAGAFHRFGRPAVRIGGTFRSLNFDDTPALGGAINNDDRDRTKYTGGAWAG
jgi:hypothetical protein